MEISIVAKDSESDDFIRFIEECKRHGFMQTREIVDAHFSYVKLKGERWDNAEKCEHKEVLILRHAAKCKECGTVFETK